jgi:spore coat polysaccharide biosynthesis protein SpsF
VDSAAGALAIVQARMSSTRLPGKTLADVEGEPMLALLLRRLARAQRIERIVVATSTEGADDPIVELAGAVGVDACRGPRDDVVERFLVAIGEREGPVVRITADCPLIDPGIVDQTIERFAAVIGCVYASNIVPRTFPDGLDVEVFDARTLRALAREPLAAADREHVTSALRDRPERFPHAALVCGENLGELRWTVDEPEDLEFVREVVRRLGEHRGRAGLAEILAAVRGEPSLASYHGRRG